MISLEYRIRDYVAHNHVLPPRLADLPPLAPNRSSSTNDAWGRPIMYAPQPDGSVILSSPGKPGGHPITLRFAISPTTNPSTESSSETGR